MPYFGFAYFVRPMQESLQSIRSTHPGSVFQDGATLLQHQLYEFHLLGSRRKRKQKVNDGEKECTNEAQLRFVLKDVAVKQLGFQGEFLVEVSMLSLLHHTHLVNLVGYWGDGEHRVVYEDMSNGSLEEPLLDEIAEGAAKAKLGPTSDKSFVSTRVMGTYGYCMPEYALTGQLTAKSDAYSFGVVFLEIITGGRVIDNTRPSEEQNLVLAIFKSIITPE
ncbi:hypothetical protein Vadar_025298 [Vaccinium darrowii]|uniref:Uncharacterized protein n=1 Tax=Vaccinium darrowii TaxID=229202 RepID=A0ACB7Z675_9ERIC|nr:hypothetical protein Vadar_025298 [Vaccinium darrowii]